MENTTDYLQLSVVIPVLNGAQYIRNALESVLEQKHPVAELIILDNASTDATPRIIDEFRSHPRIAIYRNAETLPAIAQWRKAISLTSCPIFTVLSADDLLSPDHVQTAVDIFQKHQEVGLFYCFNNAIDQHGKVFMTNAVNDPSLTGLVATHDFLSLIVGGISFYTPGVVIRRNVYEAIGGLDVRFEGAGDYDLFLRLGGATKVYSCPQVLSSYRFHPDQHSAKLFLETPTDTELLFDKIEGYRFLNVEQKKALVTNLCNAQHQLCFRWLRNPTATINQIGRARQTALASLQNWQNSRTPVAQYVSISPPKWKSRIVWLASKFTIGIIILRTILRLSRVARSFKSSL